MVRFKRFKNFEIISKFNKLSLIKELKARKTICVSTCQLDSSCKIAEVTHNDNCKLFNEKAIEYLVAKNEKDDEFIYLKERLKFTEDLVNYWAFRDSTNDIVDSKNIIIREKGSMTSNRFRMPKRALRLENGYGDLPPGNYFKTNQFTIMCWVKIFSYNNYQPIVDFGNGARTDNILISFVEVTGKLRIFFMSASGHKEKHTDCEVPKDEWVHVAVTYKNEQFQLFINTSLKLDYKPDAPILNLNIERKSNFIGKNNWNDPAIDGIIDELKIFDRALSAQEISAEKEKNEDLSLEGLLYIMQQKSSGAEEPVHYWPMAGSLRDIIGSKDIKIVTKAMFTNDRFSNKKSALRLVNGYGNLPPGNYFKTNQFTIMCWVKIFSYNSWQAIVDFGNGAWTDNILISFVGVTGKLRIFFMSASGHKEKHTDCEVPKDEWVHVAVTYKNEQFQLFINTSLKLDYKPGAPILNLNIERKSNFIGMNNWNHAAIDGIIDELKIFESALTNEKLINEMQLKQPFDKFYV